MLLTRDLRVSAIVTAATVLPFLVVTLIRVRRGSWSNFDVSDQKQRPGLYRAAIPLTIAGALILYLTGASPLMVRGTLVAGGMLLMGAVLTPLLKVSIHLMTASWSAVLLMNAFGIIAVLMVLVILAVAWSRRVLARHTRAELLAGAIVGAIGGVTAILLP